ncbi:hypothetical protein Tco_1172985, partial [Tanacetum coccineum]
LPADIYSLVNHHRVAKDLWERVQLLMQDMMNDMNTTKDEMDHFQVNPKFYKPSSTEKWSKFVTDVKLVKDLHTSNFDQLHAYLEQHELDANEVRIMRKRNQDPLAFIANQQTDPTSTSHLSVYYNNPNINNNFHQSHMD